MCVNLNLLYEDYDEDPIVVVGGKWKKWVIDRRIPDELKFIVEDYIKMDVKIVSYDDDYEIIVPEELFYAKIYEIAEKLVAACSNVIAGPAAIFKFNDRTIFYCWNLEDRKVYVTLIDWALEQPELRRRIAILLSDHL